MEKFKIVIVDDEQETCFLMKKTLEKEGIYTAFVAHDVAEGQRLCLEEHPHLVILDYVLANETSDKIINFLRTNPQMHDITAILTSGLGEMRFVENENRWAWTPPLDEKDAHKGLPPVLKWHRACEDVAKAMGVIYYLRKPFSRERLIQVVEHAIKERTKLQQEEPQ